MYDCKERKLFRQFSFALAFHPNCNTMHSHGGDLFVVQLGIAIQMAWKIDKIWMDPLDISIQMLLIYRCYRFVVVVADGE